MLRAQLAEREALLKEVLIKTDKWMLPDLYERIRMSFKSASAEPSAPVERDERAEFEAFMRSQCCSVNKTDCNNPIYFSRDVQGCWLTWQARASLERNPF